MSLTYEETRDREYLRLISPAITAFIERLPKPSNTPSPAPRHTVFFFPGGLASRLVRATKKYRPGTTEPQTFDYQDLWLTGDVLERGAGRHLEMRRDRVGVFRDSGDRIIVASGVIWDELYNGFIDWCGANNLDLLVFDWDWRRRLEDTVTFFLRTFLPFFRARVLEKGRPDPLAKFSLVGHSFGGMVANLILRANDPSVANLARVVTVATPFYGYAGQLHCWFEGHEYVNGENDTFKQEMMRVIASLPAPYTLHYLDEATFREAATRSGLAGDPEFPLPFYPSMDATVAKTPADAYNPGTNGSRVRYPAGTGFSLAELDYARLQLQQLAAPMPAHLAERFFNIRGVTTEDDGQTPKLNTTGSVTWDWVPTSFDATDPSPISDGPMVPGDGTQPAWTARLATNAPARCITVRGSNLNHIMIMKDARTLEALGSILLAPGTAMSPPVPTPPEPASDDDIVAFMRWLRRRPRRKGPALRFDDPAARDQVPPEFQEKLPGITLRIIQDILKRPAPPGLSGPGPKPKGPRRKGGKSKTASKRTTRKPTARRRRRRPGYK